MEIILLERVGKLGSLGDRVVVKNGYARNFLLPRGLAVMANETNIAEFEARRNELEKVAQEALNAAISRAEAVDGKIIVIKAKAGDEGKLFGSIGARDIVEAARLQDTALDKHEISLTEGPLRVTGDYEIQCQLHPEVIATIKVSIVGE